MIIKVGISGPPKGEQTEDKGRSFEVVYKVQSDDVADGPETAKVAAMAYSGYAIFEPYSFGNDGTDDVCRCRSISVSSPEYLVWLVSFKFEDKIETENPQQFDNPLAELPEIETHTEKFQKILSADVDGNPVTNSAGEPFDPPPMKDSSRTVLTIKRNEDINTDHPQIGLVYRDSTNADTFWGFGVGSVKCDDITANRKIKVLQDGTQYPYLEVSYSFSFAEEDTFDAVILDAGTYSLNDNGDKDAFLTSEGQPYVGLLDGGGGFLASGAAANYISIVQYPRISYSPLALPQSFLQAR